MDREESTDDRSLGFRVAEFELLPMTESPQRKSLNCPLRVTLPA